MKHVAIYSRVSTKQQDTASQDDDLKRIAAASDEPVVWYRDTFTGKSMDRPAWNRLTAALHAGKVSRIVCWRLDRLGRTASGLTALFDDLIARRVGLFSIRDSIDLGTAAGKLMANVLASIAAYETEVRADRVKAGQIVARRAGKRWGGSKPGRRLTVTDDQVRMIRKMKADKETVAAIARTTGLSRPTVYQYLAK